MTFPRLIRRFLVATSMVAATIFFVGVFTVTFTESMSEIIILGALILLMWAIVISLLACLWRENS